jgi:hypothetical protein
VQLIGTAHGNTLANLMMNPTLSDLIGGIQSVTLSDEEARRRGTQKSILERKAPPTFNVMVEIRDRRQVAVHRDVAATVDSILRGAALPAELRSRQADGSIVTVQEEVEEESWDEFQQVRRTGPALLAARARAAARRGAGAASGRASTSSGDGHRSGIEPERVDGGRMARGSSRPPRGEAATRSTAGTSPTATPRPVRIYPFGVSRNRLEAAIRSLSLAAVIVRDSRDADVVLTLKNYYRRRPQPVTDAEAAGTPIYVLRSNTSAQIDQVLASYFHVPVRVADEVEETAEEAEAPAPPAEQVTAAMQEAEDAIHQVMNRAQVVELAPQIPYIRRLQHQLAERYNLASRSRGREPNRRVFIYPGGAEP